MAGIICVHSRLWFWCGWSLVLLVEDSVCPPPSASLRGEPLQKRGDQYFQFNALQGD